MGEKEPNGKTLLFHGHTDTVGLEGYGALENYACDPEQLIQRLEDVELPEEVRKDLRSGDYMFGRGTCDMKDGDAVFLGILKDAASIRRNCQETLWYPSIRWKRICIPES